MNKNTFLFLVLMAIPLTLNAQTAVDASADTSVLRGAVVGLQADMEVVRANLRAGQNQCGAITCVQSLIAIQQQLTTIAQRPGAINYTSQLVAIQQGLTDLTGQLTNLNKAVGKLPDDTATAVETKLDPKFQKLLEAIEAKPSTSQCNQLFEYLGAGAMKASDPGDKAAISAAYTICMQQPVAVLQQKNVTLLEKNGGMIVANGNGLSMVVNSPWPRASNPWPYWMAPILGVAAGGVSAGAVHLVGGDWRAQLAIDIPTVVLTSAASIIISLATDD